MRTGTAAGGSRTVRLTVLLAAMAVGFVVVGSVTAADVVIYTKDNAPEAPQLADLPLMEEVSQYGITWKFAKPARVGQFVNGDYYVVGPVTVASVDPKPRMGDEVKDDELDFREAKANKSSVVYRNRLRNGSMLNHPATQAIAGDSGSRNYYRPALNSTYPIDMKPGDRLVSTISLNNGEESKFVYHSGGKRVAHDNSAIRVAAVLVCVDKPLPPDAFRPGYADKEATIYLARTLRRELLPKLEKVAGAPDPVKFAEVFQKVWLNPGFFGFDQPMENMPHYGQWVGQASSNASLLLCMDYTPEEKERLLINFVQVGIDYWGLIKHGHPGWEGWGGHGSGRKMPIVFAGMMLGDERMAAPTKSFPKALFGEDTQTRYGHAWHGAKVVFVGHSGMHGNTVPRKNWGPYEHLHPSQWDSPGQKNFQSEAYRRANTSCSWVGEALAARILNLEENWAHDAFFDYVDRWMYQDDTEHRKVIYAYDGNKALIDPSKSWYHQGYTGERWIKDAWQKHRKVSKAPTDGWTKDHGEQAAMHGPDAKTTPKKEPKHELPQ